MACSQDGGCPCRWTSCPFVQACGTLPLLKANRASDQPIPDPFAGWTEEIPSGQAFKPYFGPASPADIRLTLWTRHRPYTSEERKAAREQISYWTGDHDYLVASD